jgi:homoserine dehydrogenase
MMRQVRIGMIGLGTVGTAFVKQIKSNFSEENCSVEIIQVAVRDLTKPRDVNIEPSRFTNNPMEVANNPEINILVELAGGADKLPFIMQAIQNGKNVITANKAVLAAHGQEIFAAAKENKVFIGYEAAVAGAIPIIKVLRERVTMHQISNLSGILNATTNFILSMMETSGLTYEAALRKAQENGYAEADPSFDVDGFDALHKLVLLASLACKTPIDPAMIFRNGITNITAEDIALASACGTRIKLVCNLTQSEQEISLSVRPVFLPITSMLATVQDAQSCIEFTDRNAGKMIFIGGGAGGQPTASAVLQDLIDVTRGPSLAAIQAQTIGFTSNNRAIRFVDISSLPQSYCVGITSNIEKKLLVNFLITLGLEASKMRLFTSHTNALYLLVDNISLSQLSSILDKARLKEFIGHYHAIAVAPEAYALIEKQSFLTRILSTAEQQIEKLSTQCSSTLYRNSAVMAAASSKTEPSFSIRNTK